MCSSATWTTGSGDNPSSVRGYAPARRVTNVTFENMTRNGQTVLEPAAGNIVVGPHAANIAFRKQPSTRAVSGADRAIRCTGRWLRRADAASHAADVHMAFKAGSRLVYPFTGRQARVIGVTGRAAGKVDVDVDGKNQATVDTYSGTRRTQQVWYDTGVLTAGHHVLELRYEGAKNILATGAVITFDKLEIVRVAPLRKQQRNELRHEPVDVVRRLLERLAAASHGIGYLGRLTPPLLRREERVRRRSPRDPSRGTHRRRSTSSGNVNERPRGALATTDRPCDVHLLEPDEIGRVQISSSRTLRAR